jgi:tRNA (adenine37-N6)-methyltransferase
MNDIIYKPLGFFSTKQIEPYQASRQPDEFSNPGFIRLFEKNNFEQALQDLAGCSHIWIIFHFHKNSNWKPLVQTPRSEGKIGVFATRAPYRPNPIGISAVPLISIDGLKLYVGPNDLIDGTPILDIKPYHPEADRIENAKIDWLNQNDELKFNLKFSPFAEDQIDFLETHGVFDLKNFIHRQLEFDPTNKNKKRVKLNTSDIWELSYRTWRIDFIVTDKTVSILSIQSGYSMEDLTLSADPYLDKDIHRLFLNRNTIE